jgi:hypothetical protein
MKSVGVALLQARFIAPAQCRKRYGPEKARDNASRTGPEGIADTCVVAHSLGPRTHELA